MITFIFVDSIAFGLWDSGGGWADRIKRDVQAQEVRSGIKHCNEVYNLGVDGNTTTQIIERFEGEVRARLREGKKYAFIFATGINDTLHRNNKEFASSPDEYGQRLKELWSLSKKYSEKVCFVDITPVDEALTNPLKISTSGKCYTNDRIDEFNATLHKFCGMHELDLVGVHDAFTAVEYRSLLIDGIHPNSEGHELIYNKVFEVLKVYLELG